MFFTNVLLNVSIEQMWCHIQGKGARFTSLLNFASILQTYDNFQYQRLSDIFSSDSSRKWKYVNLIFLRNIEFEVSSTLTVKASTYPRPSYGTNFLTCFTGTEQVFPLDKAGNGGQGDQGLWG